MTETSDNQVEQVVAFHGTGRNDPSLVINSDVGFDIQFSRPGLYGRGLYFAKNFQYSANRKYAYCNKKEKIEKMTELIMASTKT